jgi:DNA-binding HxlR family transcriptional regulator
MSLSLEERPGRAPRYTKSLRLCKRYAPDVKRTTLADHPCSIARTLDVAGEWWSPLILRDVTYGVRRFAEIQTDLGISANVLADRLESLVGDGLLETHVYQKRPERHEYVLTEKGADLVPALVALMQWGDRWKWKGGVGPVQVLHEDCRHEVTVELRCERCEREVRVHDLRARVRRAVTMAPTGDAPGHVSAARLTSSPDGARLAEQPAQATPSE